MKFKRSKGGFTLVEIMIVVAIIALLAAIAIPNAAKARKSARKTACINNLRQIDAAKEQYALESNLTSTDKPTAAQLDDYIKGDITKLYCPSDGSKSFATSYNINAIGTNPTCKIDTTHKPEGW